MSAKKYDISQINKYLRGELDNKAMHQLEQQAQDDPFLMDALDGYETTGSDQQVNLTELQDRLTKRINAEKGRSILLWRILPIAACLLLALGTGYWLLTPKSDKPKYANVIQPEKTINPPATKKTTDTLPADKTIKKDELESLVAASPAGAKRLVKNVPKDSVISYKDTTGTLAEVSVMRDKPLPAAKMATIMTPRDYPVGNVDHLLQGKVAGLNIQNNTGAPGMRGSVNIRGIYGRSNPDTNSFTAFKSSSINFVTITGVVIDSRTKDIIPFATITTEGKYLTQTDVDGKYIVTVPEGAVLTATSVGYIAQTVKLHQQTSLNYALSANTQPLSETVIRGYVKRNPDLIPNAQYIITGKEVQDNPVGTVEQLLQGKVAPLNIHNNEDAQKNTLSEVIIAPPIKNCNENPAFKNKFFENITLLERDAFEKNGGYVTTISQKQLSDALKFMKKYTGVAIPTTKNAKAGYPDLKTFGHDKDQWLKWYNANKCNNLQLPK